MGPVQCNFVEGEAPRDDPRQASPAATPLRQALLEEGCSDIGLWLELVEARMSAGVTPEDFASRTGLPLAHVVRIERGEIATMPLKFLRQYAHGVGRMVKVAGQPVEGALCAEQGRCLQGKEVLR